MPSSSQFDSTSYSEASSGYGTDYKSKLNNKMGTQTAINYSELNANKPRKIAHRVALVSPRMDVDVTGVSLKNVRTHLIDHPRDEGLKHREQLWNFQQRYRGAIGKLKEIGSGSAVEEQDSADTNENSDDSYVANAKPSFVDQTSLSSRFQRRLRHKIRLASMRPGDYFDSARRRVSSKESTSEEERRPSIQRLYSSGLIVKNTLYNQIRQADSNNEDRDDSKILAAIEKYGSLEKLPDIPYTPSRHSNTPQYRYIKSFSTSGRRTGDESAIERRYFSIRRSFTNITDMESRNKRLVIVSNPRRRGDRMLHCLDSENDDDDEDDNEDEDDIDEDECDNEPRNMEPGKRDCDQKHPDHIDIRNNITKVHTQDDMVLLEKRNIGDIKQRNGLVTDRTFYSAKKTITIPRKFDTYKENFECNGVAASATSSSESAKSIQTKSKHNKGIRDTKSSNKNGNNKKGQKDTSSEALDRADSTESLDIPGDRYGPTTHSIDKKLSIRKPWEWKPSPYRWIDRAYVRESDKPYIERIINKGEIIDEFNYDSYARTRPLKLQSFPDGAGYKDRHGHLR